MKTRQHNLGNRNIVGNRVTIARISKGIKQSDLLAKLQVSGIDITSSGLSKLEGQHRHVTDIELLTLSTVLGVSVNWLLNLE